jgi:hypothetical protein
VTAVPVARLSPTVQASCPLCEQRATWAIGPTERSCTRCLGARLEDLYAAEPHPFQPYLPTPLRRGNW